MNEVRSATPATTTTAHPAPRHPRHASPRVPLSSPFVRSPTPTSSHARTRFALRTGRRHDRTARGAAPSRPSEPPRFHPSYPLASRPRSRTALPRLRARPHAHTPHPTRRPLRPSLALAPRGAPASPCGACASGRERGHRALDRPRTALGIGRGIGRPCGRGQLALAWRRRTGPGTLSARGRGRVGNERRGHGARRDWALVTPRHARLRGASTSNVDEWIAPTPRTRARGPREARAHPFAHPAAPTRPRHSVERARPRLCPRPCARATTTPPDFPSSARRFACPISPSRISDAGADIRFPASFPDSAALSWPS